MKEITFTYYKSDYYGTWIVISSLSGFHTFTTENAAVRFMRSETLLYGTPTGPDTATQTVFKVS